MTLDAQSARRRGSSAPAMLLPGAALTCWLSELRIQAPVKRDAAKARGNWAARSDAARLDHGVPVSFPVAAGGTSGLPGTPSVGEPNHSLLTWRDSGKAFTNAEPRHRLSISSPSETP